MRVVPLLVRHPTAHLVRFVVQLQSIDAGVINARDEIKVDVSLCIRCYSVEFFDKNSISLPRLTQDIQVFQQGRAVYVHIKSPTAESTAVQLGAEPCLREVEPYTITPFGNRDFIGERSIPFPRDEVLIQRALYMFIPYRECAPVKYRSAAQVTPFGWVYGAALAMIRIGMSLPVSPAVSSMELT